MKLISVAVITSMLLLGLVGAEDTNKLSTIGNKPVIAPIEIKYEKTVQTNNVEAVNLSTIGMVGVTPGATGDFTVIKSSSPTTYTPLFAISSSNMTLTRAGTYEPFIATTTIYTPPFAISASNRTLTTTGAYTPPFAVGSGLTVATPSTMI